MHLYKSVGRLRRIFRKYVAIMGIRQALRLFAYYFIGTPQTKIQLRIKNISTPVFCRPKKSDIYPLSHVFFDRDCDVELKAKPRLIIDGGANVGYASVLLANLYPDAVVLAIEPDLENCCLARENCQAYPNVKIIQAGLWKRSARLIIDDPNVPNWAFQVREASSDMPNAITGYSIQDLLDEHGFAAVDLLKMDIEGTEEVIFSQGNLDWVDNTEVVVVEVHGESARSAVTCALEASLFRCSFKGEKLIFTNSRPRLNA